MAELKRQVLIRIPGNDEPYLVMDGVEFAKIIEDYEEHAKMREHKFIGYCDELEASQDGILRQLRLGMDRKTINYVGPHKCPICEGKTHVPEAFYDNVQRTRAGTTPCKSCQGKGIIK